MFFLLYCAFHNFSIVVNFHLNRIFFIVAIAKVFYPRTFERLRKDTEVLRSDRNARTAKKRNKQQNFQPTGHACFPHFFIPPLFFLFHFIFYLYWN